MLDVNVKSKDLKFSNNFNLWMSFLILILTRFAFIDIFLLIFDIFLQYLYLWIHWLDQCFNKKIAYCYSLNSASVNFIAHALCLFACISQREAALANPHHGSHPFRMHGCEHSQIELVNSRVALIDNP